MIRLFVIGIALSFAGIYSNATENLSSRLFPDKSTNYMGQKADNEKDITGMGIKKLKNGIYIGDFLFSKFNGKGMLVSDNNKISNCEGCHIYVGEWFKGKKEGYGTCYDTSGAIIYSGNFENDKPSGIYPSPSTSKSACFSVIRHEAIGKSGEFHGEILNGKPNGFGIFICKDGQSWIGDFKKGKPIGVGMLLLNESQWVIKKYKTNGKYKEINSSNAVAQRKGEVAQIKAEESARNKQELKQYLSEVSSFASTVAQSKNNSNQTVRTGASQYQSQQTSSKSKSKSKSTVKAETSDCGTAWRSDANVYDNYDDQLVMMETYPERYGTASQYKAQYKDIQKKMRSIRQKWEAKGCKITKSPRESKSI